MTEKKMRGFIAPFILGAGLLASLATCHWFMAAFIAFLAACWLVMFDE